MYELFFHFDEKIRKFRLAHWKNIISNNGNSLKQSEKEISFGFHRQTNKKRENVSMDALSHC